MCVKMTNCHRTQTRLVRLEVTGEFRPNKAVQRLHSEPGARAEEKKKKTEAIAPISIGRLSRARARIKKVSGLSPA